MVMNAVSMNLMPGTAKQTGIQESESGFSSVLDSVSSENRQQGCAPQKKSDFSYTEKAADAKPAELKADGETISAADSFKKEFSEAAENVLDEAVKLVASSLKGEDKAFPKDDIRDMLIEAVKTIIEQKKSEDEENKSLDSLLEAILAVLNGQTDIAAVITDFSVFAETEIITAVEVQTVTAAAGAPMPQVSAKHDEAAMLVTEGEVTTAETDAESSVLSAETAVGTVLPETIVSEQEASAGTDVNIQQNAAESAAAAEEELPEENFGTVNTADENLAALNELLAKAKEDLGLTEVSVKTVPREAAQDNTAPAAEEANQARTEQPAETSVKMNRSDRSEELDYILSGGKEESGTPVKTETYDAVHMSAELIADRGITNEVPVSEPIADDMQTVRPPEVQAAEQILARMDRMQSGETEFTMVLNPESLGRITVRLVTAGERVAVEITAENAETRELLASRTENLQSMLRDNGVQLERYQVVEENEDAELMQQNYDGSSKNPYGRQQEQQEQDEDGENFYELLQQI